VQSAAVAEIPFWMSKSLIALDLSWLLIVKLIRGLFDLEEYWLAAINRLRMFNRRFVFKKQTQPNCRSGRFIIFIGQVRNDINHTHFGVNDAEIEMCLRNILSADQGLQLMWRDHPLELSDHTFNKLSKEFPSRVFRAKQISLQQAMKAAEGAVTVNSNGGLEALAVGLPVRLLGRSYFGTLNGVCRDNESFAILREKNRELGPNKLIQADAARFINDCFLPIDYRGGDFKNVHLAADLILLCKTQNSQ
jgi:capsule polysaccharide modification protein KpsS